jgi:Superfamily II DNA/RNA helicases, SNF2 family
MQVPGVSAVLKTPFYKAPLAWSTCLALRGIFKDSLEIEGSLLEWANGERLEIDRRLTARLSEATFSETPMFPFQKRGATFLGVARGALLGDQPGLGKTIQAIHALNTYEALPALIVCPNSVKHTWKLEFERWAPDLTISVVSGTASQRRKALAPGSDVYVVNYESVRAHSRIERYGSIRLTDAEKEPKELQALGIKTVVVDEAHRIKNRKAVSTRAIKAVGKTADYRFALTGTPVANTPADLWSIMNFVAPEEWPSYSRFVDRYLISAPGFFGGTEIFGLNPNTTDEFYQLLDHRFLRRTKEEVLPQLPEKTYQVRYVELEAKQAKVYKSLASDMIAQIDSGILFTGNPLTQMVRLRQAASAYLTLDKEDAVSLSSPSNKIEAMLELLDERAGAPTVVFAEQRLLIDLLSSELDKTDIRYGRITGAESTEERTKAVEAFQAGKLPVILCTTAAGGVGITLTAADTVVFLQRSWSAIDNSQAEDRIHRIGQEHPVTVIDLISKGTIEQAVFDRFGDKLDQLESVVRDKNVLLSMLKAVS